MNEDNIKELMSELSKLTYYSKGCSYSFEIIKKEHLLSVEQVIRKYLLDTHDEEIGELKAKCYAYEKMIANSNFSPILGKSDSNDG